MTQNALTVADLMQRNVRSVGVDATVAEVVLSLADAHVSGLPVVDDGGRMVGVVSTSDVLTAEAETNDSAARQELLEATAVREIMTPRPYTITPDTGVREAARQMLYADVHRLFVTEESRIVGVVSTTDIVRAVAQGQI